MSQIECRIGCTHIDPMPCSEIAHLREQVAKLQATIERVRKKRNKMKNAGIGNELTGMYIVDAVAMIDEALSESEAS